MITHPEGLSLADFIAWEATQEMKHEYVHGRISLFPGVTQAHGILVMEIAVRIHAHLRGTPCRVFVSDVLTATEWSARYPDVFVTCFERDAPDPRGRVVRDPKLIIEVLSESTAAVNRGEKLDEYGSIDTLEEYVLVDSRRRWCETYRRENGVLRSSLPIRGGPLELKSLGLTLDLDELYETAGI